ncbi:NUDIX domain-containing protein [Streptosporangium saharense]|uniref:8-oxo-dGTP pyrophosphatase MutT (NUDIX family) n=1 Tax=Streptosporangium saharense TaxID=1706840 RepID=A0A7W7QLB0_9ACTN|nr:NUDIX domain-containing protein [Streptosporangium saharense]MBB4915695.1 8-oxo-dGTP pyrophosphatase MutT (NUDIX family) [Streptosporangium saharense]
MGELPGGRLEVSETPQERVETEIHEEAGWRESAGPLLDTWVYEPLPDRRVFIVTYGCTATDAHHPPVISHERKEIDALVMPQGYKDSIAHWYELTEETA